MRKFWIHVEMLYQLFNLIFSWFALVRNSAFLYVSLILSVLCLFQGNYYISFIILSESMEDPSFKLGNGVHILNVIFNYMYLGLLVACFLLALGNRPQGSKWFYTTAFIGFAVITVYMTVSDRVLGFLPIALSFRRSRSRRSSWRSKAWTTSSRPMDLSRLRACSPTLSSGTS